ncbi:MAG: immunoglobulin domain-containing protein [Chitinispirillaceae bacterium]|nr:immunoglobulin domain-containing protein [Chitinispirillaceae bacterium]
MGIAKKLLISIYGAAALFLILCDSPSNPFTDYDNCSISFISPDRADEQYRVDETVVFRIQVQASSLFNQLIFSLDNAIDTTITFSNGSDWLDTITIKRVFREPDTVMVRISGALQNKSNLTDSARIVIIGIKPAITTNPPKNLFVEIGAACSVSVAAQGSAPISYQWMKNGSRLANDTAALLLIRNFQASDSGYYICIASNPWGSASSDTMKLSVKKETDKKVFWHFAVYRDTVAEGDSLRLRIDSLYTAPASDTVSLRMLLTPRQAAFAGDSLFLFRAGARDSGSYPVSAVVSSNSGSDTATIHITVTARYHTLTLQSDSGSIRASPSASQYRWGDTVSLTAIPDSGFLFVEWQGDAAGNDTLIRVVVTKNLSITAKFIAKTTPDCIVITSGSINKAIRDVSPGSVRPKKICPAQGTYDQGTIKVWGNVRIVIQ